MPRLPTLTLACLAAFSWVYVVALGPGASTNPRNAGGSVLAAAELGAGSPFAREPTNNAADAASQAKTLAVAQPPNPETLLNEVIARLESRRSVVAKLYMNVNLFDQQMIGTGVYLEQDPLASHYLRVEMNLQHTALEATESRLQTSSLFQICDGQRWWSYRRLAGEQVPSMNCIDIQRFIRAQAKAGIKTGPGGPPWPLHGGMIKLMHQLRNYFAFDNVQGGRLKELAVWRLEAPWRADWLAKLLPDQAQAIKEKKPANLTRLSPQAPDHVVLYVGQEDLFPYQMELCRRHLPKQRQSEIVDGQPLVLLSLQLRDVVLDAPLDPGRFSYNPGDLKFPDDTEGFIQRSGLSE